MSQAKECIFCRIAANEIPCALLTASERVISFLDIAPVNPGHALVVPRAHCRGLLDASASDLEECIVTARRVARASVEASGADGFNILQNNGSCAGQVVAHLHFHVIPRRSDDGFSFGWRQGGYEGREMEEMRRRIADGLKED